MIRFENQRSRIPGEDFCLEKRGLLPFPHCGIEGWAGAVAIGAGALAAGATAYGATQSANAQKDAANQAAQSQKNANQLNYQMFQESRGSNGSAVLPTYLKGSNGGLFEAQLGGDLTKAYGDTAMPLSDFQAATGRLKPAQPMLSGEVNKAIQQLVLNEITLESSLTSRMPALQTNGLGVAMNPFLGWPLQKTYQVFRQLREPNGEATSKALRTGLTAYMAILPIGMAVSWLRNKFDEELLGRKQNVSDLGTIHDVPTALLTALDNASRVGTFGFIGEGANYFLNDDNVRPVTLDNRIFFANTIENVFNATRSLYHQTVPQLAAGNFEGAAKASTDYQTVVRPLFQTLGGNGLLQNLGALNHLLSLDDAEARVSNRISVNNYLRVAGRELGLDVRTFGGMLQNSSSPSPIKPFVGQMVLAAYANDHDGFNAALRDAVKQARQEGLNPQEATKKVVSMFEGQNPLRVVFKSPPTGSEYRRLLAQLPDNGKQSVAQALTLYQHYAQQIGAKADAFGKDKQDSPAPNLLKDDVASSLFNRMRGGMTFDKRRFVAIGTSYLP